MKSQHLVGVRSTEVHYDDTIPVVQDQPDDQCVDSSTVELEQSNAEYDLTEVVDRSVSSSFDTSDTSGVTIVTNPV
jgi:3-dehydroquinate dehydratase